MKKKILAFLLIAVLLFTLFTGCSKGDGYIGKEKAQTICLDTIGYTSEHKDALSGMKTKLVTDASTPYYLIKFSFGLYDYVFKVQADNGTILSREAEINEAYI